MKESNSAKIEFPSHSSNEAFARSAAAAFAAQLDPTLEELGDLRTAVSEAVTNAIVHAYPEDIGPVLLRMRILEGNVLEVTVKDWGRGIEDLEKAMTPLYMQDPMQPSSCRSLDHPEGSSIYQTVYMDTIATEPPPLQYHRSFEESILFFLAFPNSSIHLSFF